MKLLILIISLSQEQFSTSAYERMVIGLELLSHGNMEVMRISFGFISCF
ncbi:MAG: hypothetical protein KAT78_05390 [Flavobacteriaceae bacterium]|nr:hypothetical protein [Flavobacteriaceae bacterium]